MAFIKNILQGFLGLKKDPNATTQDTAVIKSEDTNSGIALVPNGTGAITAQIPDGTSVGGNARGTNAVDFQTSRTSPDQVASGIRSVVLGGIKNVASGQYSLAHGENNQATNVGSIAIGLGNTATARGAVAIGGYNAGNDSTGVGSSITGGESNIASSTYATISGGQSNTVSTGTHATVVGGGGNVSSGQYSISGGGGSTSSGDGAVALGGSTGASGPIASSSNCFATGLGAVASSFNAIALGRNAKSIAQSSIAMGLDSNAYIFSQYSYGSKFFSDNGDCQFSNVVLSNANTSFGGTIQIFNSAQTSILNINQSLLIPNGNNRVWNVVVKTVAVVIGTSGTTTGVTVGDVFMENKSILFKKISGVSSVVDLATDNTFADGGMGTSAMTYTAGASQELALTYTAPTFTGGGSVTVRVVSKVELVEVAY